MAEPEPRPARQRAPLYLALAVGAAAVLILAILQATGGGPAATPGNPTDTAETASPATSDQPAIGDALELGDGAVARLNAVETGITLEAGLPGPEAGMRLDRLDVEICAGTEGLFVDAAFWNGLGDDQRVHSAHMGVRHFVTLTMAPGSCQRGSVELAVPEAVELAAVLLMDTEQTTVARWAVSGSRGDVEPLASAVRPEPAAVGSTVELLVGGSATVHAIDGDATIDAELCAADQPLPVSPRHWFVQLADHRLVAGSASGPTFATGAIDAAACDRGVLDFPVPAGAPPTSVLYAYGGQFEQARWTIDR